jgi:hypothetical protein
MHRTEASGWKMRTFGLAVVSLSLGLIVTTTARAQETDNRSFSEKVSEGFYGMIRGTNMDNRGIDYRERSPLVVPPSLDLPPPVARAKEGQVANWPKDPDERQRRAVIAAKKKEAPPAGRIRTVGTDPSQQVQPINIAPPAEAPQDPGTIRPDYANDRNGTARTDPIYDKPGDLFSGGASDLADKFGMGDLFGSGKKAMPVEPGTEPARTALTQPPVGYQTPAAGYAYTEQKRGLLDGASNPDRNPLGQASSASSVVH